MNKIKVAIVGIGNCASSLVQGIEYYRDKTEADATGLMYWDIGGYTPSDVEIVAAFDVDVRKVGKDVAEAVFAPPNCTTVFCENIPATGAIVQMGCVLDGVADHMDEHPESNTFVLADVPEPGQQDIVGILKQSGAEVLMSYLPAGSEEAARFYAECALQAGVALVNNMPVFIVSDPKWAKRFEEKNIPVIGDDIKAQLGATITHRTLTDLFEKRGVTIDHMYQINTGGNTDFLNMLNRSRLASKKTSKTEAVHAVMEERLADDDIHVGPSDYIPWLKDKLSGGVYRLAEKGLAQMHDIEGRFWLDVDDETAFHKATAVLQANDDAPAKIIAGPVIVA